MEEIEKQPKAILARECGDWKIAVMEETEKDIKVEKAKQHFQHLHTACIYLCLKLKRFQENSSDSYQNQ